VHPVGCRHGSTFLTRIRLDGWDFGVGQSPRQAPWRHRSHPGMFSRSRIAM